MKCLRLALLVIFLIYVVPRQSHSHASVLEHFRKLEHEDHNTKTTHQISPSPGPVPESNLSSGNDQTPISPPQAETCDTASNNCGFKDYSVAACVPFFGNGSQASYLLVLNDGENSLNVNVVVRPANITIEDIVISGHQVKKVNLPSNTGTTSSILLTIGNSDCLIQIGAAIPQDSYTRYLTPVSGAYLFFATSILVGGTWACCKYKKTRRHLDGVPYQELEMGQQETNPSFEIGTPEGWDSNWDDDDDWDEEKAVRSPGARKTSENEPSLQYIDTTQWGRSDWED